MNIELAIDTTTIPGEINTWSGPSLTNETMTLIFKESEGEDTYIIAKPLEQPKIENKHYYTFNVDRRRRRNSLSEAETQLKNIERKILLDSPPENFIDFIYRFYIEREATFYSKGGLQCQGYKRRSCEDGYRCALNYFPNMELYDLRHFLETFGNIDHTVWQKNMDIVDCPHIRKRTFHPSYAIVGNREYVEIICHSNEILNEIINKYD